MRFRGRFSSRAGPKGRSSILSPIHYAVNRSSSTLGSVSRYGRSNGYNIAKGAGSLAMKYGAKPFSRASIAATVALVGAGTVGYVASKIGNYREGLMAGLYPGSTMPQESGRFGIRTSQTPAGIGGVKFAFRRN